MSSWRDIIKVHPAAELFPRMSAEELKALGEDIRKHGMTQPIIFWFPGEGQEGSRGTNSFKSDTVLLDGCNRLDAMEAVGIELVKDGEIFPLDLLYNRDDGKRLIKYRVVSELGYHLCDDVNLPEHGIPDPYAFVASANILRRHLTAVQKRDVIEALLRERPERSDREIGRIAKVDNKTVASVRKDLEAREEIPHVETRVDTKGRSQPAKKPAVPRPGPVSPLRLTLAQIAKVVEPTVHDEAEGVSEEELEAEVARQGSTIPAHRNREEQPGQHTGASAGAGWWRCRPTE